MIRWGAQSKIDNQIAPVSVPMHQDTGVILFVVDYFVYSILETPDTTARSQCADS